MSTESNSNDSGGALAPRYFVRIRDVGPWVEVTKKKYIDLEQAAGFRGREPGEVACATFSNGCISGSTWFPQTWNEINHNYEPSKNVILMGAAAPPEHNAHTPKKRSL